MDRHYYYRLLGLTCEATSSQIKKAYELRMAKLDSPDYADDPEYRQKKKAQATMAYRVLMGNAPVPTKNSKKNGFEKFKDALERKEEIDDDCDVCIDEDDKPSFKDRFESTLKKPSKKKPFNTINIDKKTVTSVVVSAFTLITCISTIVAAVAGDSEPDFTDYEILQSEVIYVDYDENLNYAQKADYAAKVDYNEGNDEYGDSDTYYATRDVLGALDVDDANEFFYYITDDEYYFQDYDDKTCADTMIEWIGAPDFSEVAGAENCYTGERILDHADYLWYLEECLWNQL